LGNLVKERRRGDEEMGNVYGDDAGTRRSDHLQEKEIEI